MHYARPLDVLFLVDYSDLAFRTIPFVAQLADALPLKLTLLHVREPNELPAAADERITSFFAEASRYPDCTRVVATGDLDEVLAQRLERSPFDLLLMPASTPSLFGGFRPNNPCRRLRALELTKRPVWTVG
ncbi:MAG: universal stress protein, partial [Myxococcaceae bacterium]|nr:universal stress protein [Myxococcaceae bacterium]